MRAPTDSPKRIAFSTAARFSTGSTPGSAISTAEACVFGAAPNAVDAPEKIFERVLSCTCVSIPMTVSQPFTSFTRSRIYTGWRSHMPVRIQLILMPHLKHLRLAKIVADDLQAD